MLASRACNPPPRWATRDVELDPFACQSGRHRPGASRRDPSPAVTPTVPVTLVTAREPTPGLHPGTGCVPIPSSDLMPDRLRHRTAALPTVSILPDNQLQHAASSLSGCTCSSRYRPTTTTASLVLPVMGYHAISDEIVVPPTLASKQAVSQEDRCFDGVP